LEGTNRGGAEIVVLKAAFVNDQALKDAIGSVDEDKFDFDVAWKGFGATYGKLH
jgi:hypothetical protein